MSRPAMITGPGRRLLRERAVILLCTGTLLVACLPLGWVLIDVFRLGIRHLSPDFFAAAALPGLPSWGSALAGSAMVVGIAAVLGIPVGVGTGLYVTEFGSGLLGRVARVVCEALAGLPSIVAGMAAYGLIMTATGRFSLLAGGAALAVILAPMVAMNTMAALKAVPRELREAASALGLGEATTVLRIVLPAALPHVVTGTLMAFGRVVGETAPLLVTVLAVGGGLPRPGATVPTHVYAHATTSAPSWEGEAWAGALILVTAVFVLHAAAMSIWSRRGRILPVRADRFPTGG